MDAISLFAGMLIALAVGAALGYLYARSKLAGLSADLTGQASAAEERARCGAQERAALVDGQLAERFQAMSAQALDRSARTFLELAEGRLGAANARAAGELESRRAAVEHLVQPLRETLAKVEGQLQGDRGGPAALACRAGRAGHDRPAELGAAARADPGAGDGAAAAGGPGPVGRDAAAPGGGAGRDEPAL